ncbi:MAG TPA: hypothetical protein VLJ76_06645 [Gaiellaceae bacterium]|nr:hypothetical protein [Gaiellaceae bacterium]
MSRRVLTALPLVIVAAVIAGCGGGSSAPPTVTGAKTFSLIDFTPSKPAQAGKPTIVSFKIQEPDGSIMTKFKRGPGPHTGVHLIMVRRDLGAIVHEHPPEQPGGLFKIPVTFTEPGPYKVVVDVYPATTNKFLVNFQLPGTLTVAGKYVPEPLPKPGTVDVVDGYRFHLVKITPPVLKAITPAFLEMTVTSPQGKPVVFKPWFGALAHAIFFRQGSLDYFHTHICSPGAGGCTSVFGASKVTGSSATPGHLTVGVLVPLSGTWRLFLQMKPGAQVLTAPFTLRVH